MIRKIILPTVAALLLTSGLNAAEKGVDAEEKKDEMSSLFQDSEHQEKIYYRVKGKARDPFFVKGVVSAPVKATVVNDETIQEALNTSVRVVMRGENPVCLIAMDKARVRVFPGGTFELKIANKVLSVKMKKINATDVVFVVNDKTFKVTK